MNVDIIVTKAEDEPNKKYELRGTLLKYDDPFRSVSEDDWEALRGKKKKGK